ncbi:MAG: hypothetical protein IKN16_10750 [Selenomonadaceae bacterium]|nr:hypothetical protein [Selenomonadaceae bacterium]
MNDFFNVLDDFEFEDFVADGESSSFLLAADSASDSSGEREAATEEYINNVKGDKADVTESGQYVWRGGESQNPFSGDTSGVYFTIKSSSLTSTAKTDGGESGDLTYYEIGLNDIEIITISSVDISNPLTIDNKLDVAGDNISLTLTSGNVTGGVFNRGDSTVTLAEPGANDATYNGATTVITLDGFTNPDPNAELTAEDFGWTSNGTNLTAVYTSGEENGTVTVQGDYNFEVDGKAVAVKNMTIADTAAAAAAIVFKYGENGETTLDLSALVADGDKVITVQEAEVDKIVPPAAETEIKIGGSSYTYALGTNSEATFELTSGAVTGFTLTVTGDAITVGKNQDIAIYDDDADDPTAAIVSVDGSNYTVTKTANGYALAITDSAEVTIDGTTLDFNISSATKAALSANNANNAIVINFDEDGITGVTNLYRLTSESDSLTVTGATATDADGGLPVFNSRGVLNNIAVDKGAFTLVGGATGEQELQVASGSTVYEVYTDMNVALSGGSGTVTDGVNKVTYTANGGHFEADTANNITEYVFENKGDSILLANDNALPVSYNGTDIVLPTVTGDTNGYTVTLTDVSDATDPKFEVSDLDVGATVTDADDTVTTKATTDTVEFDAKGNITGAETTGNNDFTLPAAGNTRTLKFGLETLVVTPGANHADGDVITVVSDVSGVVSVSGLLPGDTISNFAPNSPEEKADTQFIFKSSGGVDTFTVNDIVYTVSNDKNGKLIIDGAGNVSDLDDGAHVHINQDALTDKISLNVNGVPYTSDQTDLTIGTEDYNINGFTKKNESLGSYQDDPEHPLINQNDTWIGVASKLAASGALKRAPGAIIGEAESADATLIADTFGTSYSTLASNDAIVDFTTGEHANERVWAVLNNDDTRSVTFNDVGNNLAVVTDNADADKVINLGNKGDFVIMDGDSDYNTVTINDGAGNDNIVVTGTEATVIDLSKGGQDRIHTFAAANANIVVNNYDEMSGAGVVVHDPEIPNITELRDAIEDGLLVFEDGKIVAIDRDETTTGVDRKSSIQINNKTKTHQTMVRLFGYKDNKDTYKDDAGQLVGFTGKDGGVLDASDIEEDVVLVGNYAGDHRSGSSLKSGAGADLVFAGAKDTIDTGDGIDNIVLDPTAGRDAATIIVGRGAGDVVENLQSGFTGDIFDVTGFDGKLDYTFENGVLGIHDRTSQSTLLAATSETGEFVQQRFINGSDTLYAAIAQEGGTITVKDGDDTVPNYFLAENGAIDFTAYSGYVGIDVDGQDIDYPSGIESSSVSIGSTVNTLIGGKGTTIFKGGEGNETLIAGTSESSLYGGGGQNFLQGTTSENKAGSTEYFVIGIHNGAQNTISGFEFINDGATNQATFDNLNLGMADGNNITGVKANADGSISIDVKGEESGATEKVTIEGAAGKEMLVDRGTQTETVAQIAASANTINHDYVDFYLATEKNATVQIGNVASAKVWLEAPDFSDGVEFVGDYTVIDARGSGAAVEMAGNSAANTIYGGLGNASMWGGAGNANDVMFGGSAHNEFYFEAGNGNDTIMSANTGDIIHLGVGLDQVDFDNTNITSYGVDVKLTDGSTLTINSTAEVSFSLEDGTNLKVNRSTQQFE